MSLITTNNLNKSYGPKVIFQGISLSIPYKARIAIVGRNGIGKTTLIRILAGEEEPSSGKIQIANKISIGYLPQGKDIESSQTLWENCLSAYSNILELEKRLKKLDGELETKKKEVDLDAYGKLQTKFEHLGGYTYQTEIERVLSGLGFSEDHYTFPLSKLSGGQRTRAILAKLLLGKHELLILDEPTNHLDIQTVEWLENYLKDWEGSILIVSHDRYFIDRTANVIWEMSPAGFEVYRGNYSNYLKQRKIRWNERKQFVNSEISRMEKELDYIRKNISSQRTQQAQGKLSRLSREIKAIETHGFLGVKGKKWGEIGNSAWKPMKVEEAAKRLSALKLRDNEQNLVKIEIRAKDRSGNIILRSNNVKLGYPKTPLFSTNQLELRRLECAALIGPNGAGKTTFLKTIMGQIQPIDGEITLGESLKIGYFTQAHEDLDPKSTLIEEIDKIKTGMLEKDIRKYLGKFLFSGDDHYKKVSVLSGGERGRLALAKLALSNANFLILDEPSNHLDIPSQEIIQKVLLEFNGTILLVSHDRYLINALATQIWEIDPQNKSLLVFKGNYSEYKKSQGEKETPKQSKQKYHEKTNIDITQDKLLSKNEKKRKQEKINQMEDMILNIESNMSLITKKMNKTNANHEKLQEISEEYAYLEKELEQAISEWEKLQE